MYREFFEAKEVSSLLVGFSVAKVIDVEHTNEHGKEIEAISITFTNDHHVAVDMLVSSYGTFISEPYAVKDNLFAIRNNETKC